MNEIKCNVTKSTQVLIKANSSTANLDEPLYAINWFSTKVEWMYHFYNFLASRSVLKVGGEAFFKGKITKTILDNNKASRDLILIVRYPEGQSFKALIESAYFKLVSVFRTMSVKKFSFGFTQKQMANDSKVTENLAYVIHHFKSPIIDDSVFSRATDLLERDVKIKYAGKTVAQLFIQEVNKDRKQVPNLMDGLLIYESTSEDEILKMISAPEYQSFIKEIDTSYIGTIKRVL